MHTQLFAQASGANLLLKSKIKQWAHASAGLFPTVASSPSQFVRWKEVEGTSEEDAVAWAPLKCLKRAMIKLHRAYNGDVSMLVDICRQMIVFEEVKDLLVCLERILSDEQVVVERIKNRLDDDHDAAASAGYRSAESVCVRARACACVCVCSWMCIFMYPPMVSITVPTHSCVCVCVFVCVCVCLHIHMCILAHT